jgi:alkylation response protein AidB-like acyl-CoA dehydrogenase
MPSLFLPWNGALALFLVERSASGVSTQAYLTQDGSRAAEVVLSKASAQLITVNGLTALEEAVDIGIACSCAEAVGVMDKTLAITVDYMNTRKQFGVNIASFQALRHRVADMKMQLELGRSMSYYASLKLHAPAEERRRAMARAKYQLGTSMRFIGQQSVQLHGGIAVTDEYIVSHYFKKLTQLDMTLWRHLAPAGRSLGPHAGDGRRVRLIRSTNPRKVGGRRGSGDVAKRSASEPETRRPFVLRLNTRSLVIE